MHLVHGSFAIFRTILLCKYSAPSLLLLERAVCVLFLCSVQRKTFAEVIAHVEPHVAHFPLQKEKDFSKTGLCGLLVLWTTCTTSLTAKTTRSVHSNAFRFHFIQLILGRNVLKCQTAKSFMTFRDEVQWAFNQFETKPHNYKSPPDSLVRCTVCKASPVGRLNGLIVTGRG